MLRAEGVAINRKHVQRLMRRMGIAALGPKPRTSKPAPGRIERALPHGNVAAALGTLRKIALDRLTLSTAKDAASRRFCDLVVAMSSTA